MKIFLFSLYGISMLLLTNKALAESPDVEFCVSGNRGSMQLVNQFEKAKTESAITKEILAATKTAKPQEKNLFSQAEPECEKCKESVLKGISAEAIEKIRSHTRVTTQINPNCLAAANSFEEKTVQEIDCPLNQPIKQLSGPRLKGTNGNPTRACMTQEMLDYQGHTISQMMTCFKKYSSSPITPSSLFEIYARESTLRPSYSSTNGHGFGQLTDIFALDAAGRGNELMKKLANDDTDECKSVKILASKTFNKKYRLPKNRCDFFQYGEGAERNVLYSLIGLNTNWERNLTKSKDLRNYMEKHAKNTALPMVLEKILQTSYGRHGIAGAYSVLSSYKGLEPKQFIAKLNSKPNSMSESDPRKYVSELNDRMVEMLQFIDPKSDLHQNIKSNGARACL